MKRTCGPNNKTSTFFSAKVLLASVDEVCSAGMSTSLLVTKMEAAAKEENFDAEIFAVSSTEANNTLAEKNVKILLFRSGLHLRH
jgi:galactitol-specific phosphotransferase system IIB component